MNAARRARLRRLRRDAGRAGGVRARARALPELAHAAPTRSSAAALRGGARLRDGARAAGLPAALQPRPAPRALGAARCWRAPPALPANERERLPPRGHRGACSPTTTSGAAGAARRAARARSRATCSRCRWRMRFDYLTGDIARLHDARRRACCRRGRATCRATTRCWRCTLSASRNAATTSRPRTAARAALALDPLDARAHHVMAHVFEMTDRADAGVRWLSEHAPALERRHASSPRTAGGTWRCSTWRAADRRSRSRLYDERMRGRRLAAKSPT